MNLGEGLRTARVFAAWDAVMADFAGPSMPAAEVAALTSAKSFKEGVLTCRMTSSLVRTQLRFQIEAVRSRLNAKLGEECVRKIVLN